MNKIFISQNVTIKKLTYKLRVVEYRGVEKMNFNFDASGHGSDGMLIYLDTYNGANKVSEEDVTRLATFNSNSTWVIVDRPLLGGTAAALFRVESRGTTVGLDRIASVTITYGDYSVIVGVTQAANKVETTEETYELTLSATKTNVTAAGDTITIYPSGKRISVTTYSSGSTEESSTNVANPLCLYNVDNSYCTITGGTTYATLKIPANTNSSVRSITVTATLRTGEASGSITITQDAADITYTIVMNPLESRPYIIINSVTVTYYDKNGTPMYHDFSYNSDNYWNQKTTLGTIKNIYIDDSGYATMSFGTSTSVNSYRFSGAFVSDWEENDLETRARYVGSDNNTIYIETIMN